MRLLERRGRRGAMSEINVTPLVDVMLVLMIIFMVAAPLMQRGIDVNLPETRSAPDMEERRVVVTVSRDGTLYIDDRPVHADLFEERIRALAAARPGEGIYLRADRDLTYGRVLKVMDQIRLAGVFNIAMVTTPAPGPPSRGGRQAPGSGAR